jgi:hypothetical protein
MVATIFHLLIDVGDQCSTGRVIVELMMQQRQITSH